MLRILSFNTWKCEGEYHRRLPLMLEELAKCGADIIAAQELFQHRDSQEGSVRAISERLQMQPIYHPTRLRARDVDGHSIDSSSSLGLFTHLPILRSKILELPNHPKDDERHALFAEVETSIGPLMVINLHLCHLRDGDSVRWKQLEEILSDSWFTTYSGPVLLCGDFNMELSASLMQEFLADDEKVVRDLFQMGRGKEPRTSLNVLYRDDRGESIAKDAQRCIDYIFLICNRSDVEEFKAAQARMVMNKPLGPDSIFPSDHAGVLVELDRSPAAHAARRKARIARAALP